jgi:catechol 2,3-dioxygenase-like lactoylglutathione lyase family enzyme
VNRGGPYGGPDATAAAVWRHAVAQRIAQVTVVVREYDEAIRFYTETLGFRLLEDTDLGGGKRWVRVAPAGAAGAELLLARAATPEQEACVGNQTGGRVSLFLETDDFERDYAALRGRGVVFARPPREESYGTVAVFVDLYGNKIDLIERRGSAE